MIRRALALTVAAVVLSGIVLALVVPPALRTWRDAQAGSSRPATTARTATHARPAQPLPRGGSHLHTLLWLSAISTAAGTVVLGVLAAMLVRRRLRNRRTRRYELYEVHLSMHDEARPQDLEDMVEALANVVREFPENRARDGQPFVAIELHCGPGERGLEWTLCIRCEPRVAEAIDAVIAAAYPDVRVGHRFGEPLRPIDGTLSEPGHVLRYRKGRSFVYAISSDEDADASPPIEAIAQQQIRLGRPSSVRFQLIPAPLFVEGIARRRFERHENKLARSEHWGATDAGLHGTLNQQEMRAGKRTQNRSMFWLEVQVAAETRADANLVGAAVQARRDDNHLQRRWMIVREKRYRRRFATAYPPLWPTLSLRALVSSAEIGHLLELPSARMKTVPVRRGTLPRLPAPPEVHSGLAELPLPAPAAASEAPTEAVTAVSSPNP